MKKKLLMLGAVIGLLLIVAVLTAFVMIRFVRVPSGAMLNTIHIGDRLLLSRFVSSIERGDVVMYQYPKDPATQYIKRVVGLPGETIEFRGSRVLINGSELAERRVFVEDDHTLGPLRELSSEGN